MLSSTVGGGATAKGGMEDESMERGPGAAATARATDESNATLVAGDDTTLDS